MFISYLLGSRLRVGDRVRLAGGYDQPAPWLNGKEARTGVCIGFLVESDKGEAAVIELDEPATFEGRTGKHVVLRLRYVGARWARHEIVHVELCDFMPDQKSYHEMKKGLWVESHSSYAVIS